MVLAQVSNLIDWHLIMKTDIHPKFYHSVVTCSCGNVFHTGATKPTMRVELCGKCHPFYTGEQRVVDTQGRIERMKKRYSLDS
jgi:large subunit ribosomal protein L31